MMNFERYEERIREIVSKGHDFAVRKGELGICQPGNRDCDCCDFDKVGENCSFTTIKWLLEDDGTPSAERLAGQREAWELAKKIGTIYADGDFLSDDMRNMFGVSFIYEVFESHSYAEAAEKVKAWEDSKKIKVGDVIKNKKNNYTGVVIDRSDWICTLLVKEGYFSEWNVQDCVKTGRTLPVSDWLRQIGGEE